MTRVNGSRLMIAICVIAMGMLFSQPPMARARDGSNPAQVNVTPDRRIRCRHGCLHKLDYTQSGR
jgi:hypothetical protein